MAASFASPAVPPAPRLGPADRLVLAVHDVTHPLVRSNPYGISERLRGSAVGAADLLSRGEKGDRAARLEQLAEARSRLAELAYYVDLGERLGVLDPAEALELFELGLAASVDLAARLDALIYRRTPAPFPLAPAAGSEAASC